MRYKDFELVDFLTDEFFILWVKNPDKNTQHFWEKWLSEHPEKRAIVLKAIAIIRAVGYEEGENMSDSTYIDVFENVMNADIDHSQKSRTFIHPKKNNFLKNIAAIFIFGFCAWMGYYHAFIYSLPTTELNEAFIIKRGTSLGNRSVITLADSSKVYLNSSSEITYSSNLATADRWVKLKGEGFFEIKKNGKPFTVLIENTKIEVLGTSFNVKVEEDKLSVALLTGKVMVKDEKGNQVALHPEEMLIMEKSGDLYKSEFDNLEVTGWKNNVLVFNSDNFEICRKKIENWFGVELILSGKIRKSWVYSGTYQNESLENVLRGVNLTSGLNFRIENRKVELYN
ncbi:FecR family protein [Cyclobacterium qasimii]|uniref:Anti-sigma factor n=2 Tax=Cyclobacterium qasimii TaxID=1350429 RepID=A0A512C5W7_9BACT|nr:FecR family protein [Cyclobacterium qasimii]EPR65546.1 putative anti-sigma factor [Cyclobacterium qasimii M12-11B]GEO19599.1 hypothetical protein CQA01_01330 [Cyclobacterium qasimii]